MVTVGQAVTLLAPLSGGFLPCVDPLRGSRVLSMCSAQGLGAQFTPAGALPGNPPASSAHISPVSCLPICLAALGSDPTLARCRGPATFPSSRLLNSQAVLPLWCSPASLGGEGPVGTGQWFLGTSACVPCVPLSVLSLDLAVPKVCVPELCSLLHDLAASTRFGCKGRTSPLQHSGPATRAPH